MPSSNACLIQAYEPYVEMSAAYRRDLIKPQIEVVSPTGYETPHVQLSSWLSRTLAQLSTLAKLEPNWDGYGAPRIEAGCVTAAIRLLRELDALGATSPALVPTGLGNILLEWRRPDIAIDIEVSHDGTYEACYEGPLGERDWVGDTAEGLDPDIALLIAPRREGLQLIR